MNQNSLLAYQSMLLSGQISPQKKLILDTITNEAKTAEMIAKEADIRLGSVTARINDMKNDGQIAVDRNDKSPSSGKTVEWYIASKKMLDGVKT